MATHSGILAWRIPWTEEPGGLWSTGVGLKSVSKSQTQLNRLSMHMCTVSGNGQPRCLSITGVYMRKARQRFQHCVDPEGAAALLSANCTCCNSQIVFQCFSSIAQSCPTLWNPWTAVRQASLSITNSQSLLKLMSTESVVPSNHLILWCPLLLLPSIFPSIRVFFNESVRHIRWPKYWRFSFQYSGLISFRIDWFDLLAV